VQHANLHQAASAALHPHFVSAAWQSLRDQMHYAVRTTIATPVLQKPFHTLPQIPDVSGYEPGQALNVEDLFKVGDLVDVAGTSIGKGFQGIKQSLW
jgi:ribosomal protein L3